MGHTSLFPHVPCDCVVSEHWVRGAACVVTLETRAPLPGACWVRRWSSRLSGPLVSVSVCADETPTGSTSVLPGSLPLVSSIGICADEVPAG